MTHASFARPLTARTKTANVMGSDTIAVQELLDAGDQLVEYLAQQAQAPRRRAHPASPAAPPPRRTPRRPSASCAAAPRKGGPEGADRRTPGCQFAATGLGCGGGRTPPVCAPGTASSTPWGDTRSQALSTPVAGASMMAPLPTTAHVHMTAKKTLYLANPYGFSAQQRGGPLHELMRALESMGADVWEPFARNNQIDRASAGWAYQIGQADLRDVRAADGLFAVVNGCPPDEGVMVELGLAIAWEKPVFLFRDDFRRCTDSEVYPLNLMLFTGLPADGWEAAWYGSIEEIADPGKALARWLRHDRPPGASSAEADPIEV